jgi:hypothetical protein
MSVSRVFDIFASKPIETSIHETIETIYKPIAPVYQSDLEFLIPADDTYIDQNITLYFRGKLVSGEGKHFEATDYTAVTNNFLHSLFSQCSVTLNGVASHKPANSIIIIIVMPSLRISQSRSGI